jgi:hypothetical protein
LNVNLRRPWCALTMAVCLAASIHTGAAADDLDAAKAQARALLERIAAQERELAALKAEQAALLERLEKKASPAGEPQQPAPAQVAAPPPGKAERNWLADHVRLGGYGSVRFEAGGAPGAARGFTFRRFVLTTDATPAPRIRMHTETEFERLFGLEAEKTATATAGGLQLKQALEGNNGGEIAIEQAWGQYDFAGGHGLRAGVVLVPLGRFNILHDDDYWDLPRRTLVDRDASVTPVKTAWRELGAGLVGGFQVGPAKLDYQFYVLNGATLDFNLESVAQTRDPRRNKLALEGEFALTSGAFDGSQGARAIAWRAAFSPALAGEFALSGYHGRYTPSYLSAGEPVNSLAFDYQWRRGPLALEGEAVYTSFGRVRRVIDAFAATAFRSAAETSTLEARQLESEIEFELGGLARTRYGFWTDIKYYWRPRWLKRTFLGRPFDDPVLIPILRYERVWLNRRLEELAFANGAVTALETADFEQDRVSLGLSYRPLRSFGLQLALERNRRLNGAQLIFPRVDARTAAGLVGGLVFSF